MVKKVSNTSDTNSESEREQVNETEVLRNIRNLDLYIVGLQIVGISIICSVYEDWVLKIREIDILNKTNYGDNYEEPEVIENFSNLFFLYGANILASVDYERYKRLNATVGQERDEREIRKANIIYIESLLNFISAILGRIRIST